MQFGEWMSYFWGLFKIFIKVLVTFILLCFIIRLTLKLLCSEISETTFKLLIEFSNQMPNIIVHFFSFFLNMYQNIEYFLWLFLYFFTNLIEVIVFFWFKRKLKFRPHAFAGLVTVFFCIKALWKLWFQK